MEENVNQTITDDQELAKVLSGFSDQPASDANTIPPLTTTLPPPVPNSTSTPEPADEAGQPLDEVPTLSPEAAPEPEASFVTPLQPVAEPVLPVLVDGELDSIKKQALDELRPLVDKLNVEPDEKFDTYLLLLRSTDDKELIAPAHEAAKAIPDETRRAQALLDIIKEIDFFSKDKPAA